MAEAEPACRRLVVAVDGPAAAGKSTVAAAVARRIDGVYFDTGVLYRALTLAARERGINPDDAEQLAELAAHLDVEVRPPSVNDGRQFDVLLNGRDVTWAIRAPEVDREVSAVSAHPNVRRALLDLQRRIARSGRVVMVGRDIGTVVVPDADVKIWLDASIEERARRRQADLAMQGIQRSLDDLRDEMAMRDRLDASRGTAPMQPAADAVRINTDDRSIEEVVDMVTRLVEAACRR